MSNLKPCPFCGGGNIGHIAKSNSLEYSCMDCAMLWVDGSPNDLATWTRAVDAWNTRTPDPRIAQLEAAIKKDSQLLAKVLFENAELLTEVAAMRDVISYGKTLKGVRYNHIKPTTKEE